MLYIIVFLMPSSTDRYKQSKIHSPSLHPSLCCHWVIIVPSLSVLSAHL